jgi:hypothetical protein
MKNDLLVKTSGTLVFGEPCGVLGCISKKVVNFLKAKVFTVIICFRHFNYYKLIQVTIFNAFCLRMNLG